MNKTSSFLLAALTLVIGLGGGYLIGAKKSLPEPTPSPIGMHQMPDGSMMPNSPGAPHMDMSAMMKEMNDELRNKTGNTLDRAFLDEMIIHHEGAVDMANILLEKTMRPELKKMGEDIVRAQTQEIAQMKAWRTEWFSTEKN